MYNNLFHDHGDEEKAKIEGKYKGRKPIADTQRMEVLRLNAEGLTKAAIASKLNIGEATVYRVLAATHKT